MWYLKTHLRFQLLLCLSFGTLITSTDSVSVLPAENHNNAGDENLSRSNRAALDSSSSSRPLGFVAEWEFHDEVGDKEQIPERATTATWNNRNIKNRHDINHVYQNPSSSSSSQSQSQSQKNKNFPSIRTEPGIWQSPNGSLWLFGGHSPEQKAKKNNDKVEQDQQQQEQSTPTALNDLWVYEKNHDEDDKFTWKKLLYKPQEKSGDSNTFPENIAYPLTLCGYNGILGLFGNLPTNDKDSSYSSSSAALIDDNSVWVYKVPQIESLFKSTSNSNRNRNSSPSNNKNNNDDDEEGVWTSYMCCDLCLSDDNDNNNNKTTNLNFCPHFSQPAQQSTILSSAKQEVNPFTRERRSTAAETTTRSLKIQPILWCARDSLMALQLTFTKSENLDYSAVKAKVASASNGESTSSSSYSYASISTSSSTMSQSSDENKRYSSESRTFEPNIHLSSNSLFESGLQAYTGAEQAQAHSMQDEHQQQQQHQAITNKVTEKSSSTKANEQLSEFPTSSSSWSLHNNSTPPFNSQRASSFLQVVEDAAEEKGSGSSSRSQIGSPIHSKISSKDKTNFLKDGDESLSSTYSASSAHGRRIYDHDDDELKSNLNWWKFNLVTTQWEKLPQVNINKEEKKEGKKTAAAEKKKVNSKSHNEIYYYKLFDKEVCRTVSDSVNNLYFLCIPNEEGKESSSSSSMKSQENTSLKRQVYVFNLIKATIQELSTPIQLNNAFLNLNLWRNDTLSILNALHLSECNCTLLMIAYNKLIDFWIHNYTTGQLNMVENIWKGNTLDTFQHYTTSFYKLKINMKISGAFSTSHVVFMLNPRNNDGFFEFNETTSESSTTIEGSGSSTWFTINIESDENIFLPAKDASFMINNNEQVEQSESLMNSAAEIQGNEHKDEHKHKQEQQQQQFISSLPTPSYLKAKEPPSPAYLSAEKEVKAVLLDDEPKKRKFPVDYENNNKQEDKIQFISQEQILQQQQQRKYKQKKQRVTTPAPVPTSTSTTLTSTNTTILKGELEKGSSSEDSKSSSSSSIFNTNPSNSTFTNAFTEKKWESSYNMTSNNNNIVNSSTNFGKDSHSHSQQQKNQKEKMAKDEDNNNSYQKDKSTTSNNTSKRRNMLPRSTITTGEKTDATDVPTTLTKETETGARVKAAEASIFNLLASQTQIKNLTSGQRETFNQDELLPLALPLTQEFPSETRYNDTNTTPGQRFITTKEDTSSTTTGINNSMVSSDSSQLNPADKTEEPSFLIQLLDNSQKEKQQPLLVPEKGLKLDTNGSNSQAHTSNSPSTLSSSNSIDSVINNGTTFNLSNTAAGTGSADNNNSQVSPSLSHLIMSSVYNNSNTGRKTIINSNIRRSTSRNEPEPPQQLKLQEPADDDDDQLASNSKSETSSNSISKIDTDNSESDIPLQHASITINVSEIDDDQYYEEENNGTNSNFSRNTDDINNTGTSYTTILFFALSITIFATIGIVFFIRTCVKCPNITEKGDVLVVQDPLGLGGVVGTSGFLSTSAPVVAPRSMRYSLTTPDDFYMNTPIV